jgi:rhamnulokinase
LADERRYIAVDLGAESGKVMLGSVSKDKLAIEEIHRFNNGPVEENNSLRWDFYRLLGEIKTGISKAVKAAKAKVYGIGVDSWGSDFGLIGSDGKLLENPYHYRDSRTEAAMREVLKFMDKRSIYENTGIGLMLFNNLYQLLSMRMVNPDVLAKAKYLIFTADLYSYHLCGRVYCEYTLASTSQMMDMKTGRWSKEIFDKLALPIGIIPGVVKPGTIVGRLTEEAAKEIGCEPIDVIAVGSHDTADAVAAVPARGNRWAYISSGTWSLMGAEINEAIINDKTFEYQFTNEGGVESTIRLLKNIMGLWLVQECRRQWQKEGIDLSYKEIADMAEKAVPFAAHIDPDYSGFYSPGDMPKRINEYLGRTAQKPTDDKGRMIRVILESLAFKYRSVMEAIEDITDKAIEVLHIVGGGIQNELLCQFTANATGKKVITGPVEATASGNILMQAKATGQIKSLAELREIVRKSFELKEYQPQDNEIWKKKYEKFLITSRGAI